jgi:hypothetical protein
MMVLIYLRVDRLSATESFLVMFLRVLNFFFDHQTFHHRFISGYGCGLKDFPGIYGRISEVRQWIRNICAV